MAESTAHTRLGATPQDMAFYKLIRGITWLVAKVWCRITITGAAHVPDGPFILAPVHRSNIDSPIVSLVTRQRMRFMGKEQMWKYKPLAWFSTAVGGFPVSRGQADRDALRLCQELLEGGEPIVMFPEGTRCSGPVVQELFDGPAFVAGRAGVPIVPVGIGGSEAVLPKGAKMLRRSKLTIVVGPPIAPPARTEGGRVSRGAVRSTTEELSATLQVLFDEAQRMAGTR